MNLAIYVETLREQLIAAAASGGPESTADEITRELAPGAVEVRLRGSDPDFVVTTSGSAASPTVISAGDAEGGTSRLNLRLPEGLKAKIEEAARREGLSLNAWLVRAAAVAVQDTQAQMSRRSPRGSQEYIGWVR